MPVRLHGVMHGTSAEAGELVDATQSRIRGWASRGWVRSHTVANTNLYNLNDIKKRARIRDKDFRNRAAYQRSIWLRVSTETLDGINALAAELDISQSDWLRLLLDRAVLSGSKAFRRTYRKGVADERARCLRIIEAS